MSGISILNKNVSINSFLNVSGNSIFNNNITINSNLNIINNTILNNTTILSNLNITGKSIFNSTVLMNGEVTFITIPTVLNTGVPSDNNSLVTKSYVDNLLAGGSGSNNKTYILVNSGDESVAYFNDVPEYQAYRYFNTIKIRILPNTRFYINPYNNNTYLRYYLLSYTGILQTMFTQISPINPYNNPAYKCGYLFSFLKKSDNSIDMAYGNQASWCIPLNNNSFLFDNITNWSLIFQISITSTATNKTRMDIIFDDPLTFWSSPTSNSETYMDTQSSLFPKTDTTLSYYYNSLPTLSINFFTNTIIVHYNPPPTTLPKKWTSSGTEINNDGVFISPIPLMNTSYIIISYTNEDGIPTIKISFFYFNGLPICVLTIDYTYENNKTPFTIYNYNLGLAGSPTTGDLTYKYGILLGCGYNINDTEFINKYKYYADTTKINLNEPSFYNLT